MNEKVLDLPSFTTAVTALQTQVIDSSDFRILPIDDTAIFSSITAIRKHNINATDAAILTALLDYALASGVECVLIASDKRLVRAAQAEGLKTINPQEVNANGVPALLSVL